MVQNKKIKICIIRNDRMGDMILTLPIIREIKETIPNSIVTVVCSNTNCFLCEEADFIDKVLIYETQLNLIFKINFYLKFARNRYDYIFNLSQNIESFLFFLINFSKEKLSLIYLSRYKNPKFSKIFQRIIVKILAIENIIVDRNKFFKKEKNFHQTNLIYKLTKKKINIRNPKTFLMSPKVNTLEKNTNTSRILIHLTSKWIDKKYSENSFINLIEKLQTYGKLYLTTDHSSEEKFKTIFENYLIVSNSNFSNLSKHNNKIIILDKFNFKNWRNIILNSRLVITYECGCVHVASMSDVPLIVVYDYDNKPLMINREYAPLSLKYEKVISKQELINENILLKLKNFGF
tara:strand:+ start:2640 stop:3683 length:1044 start_codon:yes stop_codon:yes gene_type:complete